MKKLQNILFNFLLLPMQKLNPQGTFSLCRLTSARQNAKRTVRIYAVLLCATLLSGCEYNIPGLGKKNAPVARQHTPGKQVKQQYAEQNPALASKLKEDPLSGIEKPNTLKIALLLPLSGNYKDLGRGMQDAAQLALFRIGDPRLTIVPIDTKDSPAGAVAAAKEAVAQDAKIILGPIFSSGAKAIAKIAADSNIQVVSFSNDASLAGSGVFAIGTMPEQQINRIVNFAIEKGIKDFITLLPSDAYGGAVANELQQVVTRTQGTSIIKNEAYQSDPKGLIISLDEHVKSTFNAAAVAPGTLKSIILPANSAAITQIFGAISKNNYDKSKIKFLGSDQWNNPASLANPLLEGSWFTALPSERRRDFEGEFKEIYGYEAPKLSSLAYDGVALAATIARNANGEGHFLRESLTNPRGFIGVDGIFRLQDNGLTERGFAIMEARGGRAVLIDAAPTSFANSK